MQHLSRVDVLEGEHQLGEDVQQLLLRQQATLSAPQVVGQGAAGHELHDDEHAAAVREAAEEAHDQRVAEARDDLDLRLGDLGCVLHLDLLQHHQLFVRLALAEGDCAECAATQHLQLLKIVQHHGRATKKTIIVIFTVGNLSD